MASEIIPAALYHTGGLFPGEGFPQTETPWTETPLARQEVTSYRDPPVDRQTLLKTSFAGGNYEWKESTSEKFIENSPYFQDVRQYWLTCRNDRLLEILFNSICNFLEKNYSL